MADEKKYSVVGTVTIGTDEYRDLIEDKLQSEKECERYSSKYWDEYRKNGELEKQVKELSAKVEQYAKYIKDNNEQDKLELWIVKTLRCED